MKKLALFGLLVCAVATASAADKTWQAAPANGLWNNAVNWDAAIANNDRLIFNTSGIAALTNDFAADSSFTLLFQPGASAYTIDGNRIRLAGLTNNSGVTQTLNANVLVNGNVEFRGNGNVALNGVTSYSSGYLYNFIGGGTLTVANLAMSAAFTLGVHTEKGGLNTVGSSKDSATVIGNVSGAFNFINGSLGKVYLTGTNTYTGQTILSSNSYTELLYATGEDADGLDKKLSASNSNLLIYSGTLMLNGGNTRETLLQGMQLGRGSFGFGQVTIDRSSGSSTMYFGNAGAAITRNSNSMLSVGAANLVGAANANFFGNGYAGSGVVASYITVNGQDWGVRDSVTGMLRALTGTGAGGYNVDFATWAGKSDAGARATNAYLVGDGAITGTTQINNLKLNTAGADAKLTIENGRTMALFGGGLIFVGDHNYEITGGAVRADNTNGYEINIWQSGAGELTIGSNLEEFRHLNKTGAGTLILSGSNNFRTDGNAQISIFSGTLKLGGDHALYAPSAILGIQTGVLDINGHNATVRQVIGQSDGNFTFTNSDTGKQVDLIIGIRDGTSTSEYYGLGGNTLVTGNLRLVLQGNATTPVLLRTANTHLGGTYIIGNADGVRGGLSTYRFYTTKAFGDGVIELGDGGGFSITGDYNATDGWTAFGNKMVVSGTNTFIYAESKGLTATGKWSGGGDIEFRSGANANNATNNNAVTLNNDMTEFTGTIKLSGAAQNQWNSGLSVWNVTAKASVNFITGSALNSADATYTLWRPSEGGLIGSSTLNTTLQVRGAGNYNVYLGDLTSGNEMNGDARLSGGIAGEKSQGAVSNDSGNTVANLVVGSANHAYSEFAERVMDSGYLDHTGAIQNVKAGAKVAVTKVGTGTWALTGNNTYTGATTVSGGVLLIDGNGSINTTAGVLVETGGKLAYNSGVALTKQVIVEGALGGNGHIDAQVNFINGTLSPGNSIDTLYFDQSQTWNSFTYDWELGNPAGLTPGTDWDLVSVNGNLTFNLSHNYTLNVIGDEVAGIANEFEIFRTTGSGDIINFDETKWTVNGVQGDHVFRLDGGSLYLSFEAIPEPSTWALLLGGAALLVVLRRHRKE